MGHGDPKIPFSGPVLRARAVPLSPEVLQERAVFAFAGIGHPERFGDLLKASGARVMDMRTFADHHAFSVHEISELRQAAERLNAQLVTTEKDYVRLEPAQRAGIVPIPVKAEFDDKIVTAALLDRLASERKDGSA